MRLEHSIEELLFHHDCVIIPRFGGFIGSYAPAHIHRTSNTFFPPYKSLLFNINLQQNDGLLAHHLSESHKISYDHALKFIEETVGEWTEILKENKKLVLGQIGELIAEEEGNIVFHQNSQANFLSESFGLASYISPVVRRTMETVHPASENKFRIPSIVKWAAMLALPVGLATWIGFHQYDRFREITASYSGIFFSSSRTINETHKPIYVIPKPKSQAPAQKKEIRVDSVKNVQAQPYAVIVGAFRFPENAENLIHSLKNKGYDASVYDVTTRGLTRVTIGTYSAKDEALRQLALVRNDVTSAWLLSR